MAGGRWEREREKEGGGGIIHLPAASQQSGWWVVGSWPPFHATPLPPSFLSAACYYSEATIFYFFLLSLYDHYYYQPSWSLHFFFAHGVGQGYQEGSRRRQGVGAWFVGGAPWWQIRADRARPAMWVFLPVSCSGGASGGQRWLLLNVGERSYRADAVRRRPPGGQFWGGRVVVGFSLSHSPRYRLLSLSDWLTVRGTRVLSGPPKGHAMPWPRHAMLLSLFPSPSCMCVCTIRHAHRGREIEMGASGLRPSLCRPTDRPQGRSDVMTLARQVVCFFSCVFCVASGPWGNTRLRHVIF